MMRGLGIFNSDIRKRECDPDFDTRAKESFRRIDEAEKLKRKIAERHANSSLPEKEWDVTFENLLVIPENEVSLERLKKWNPEMKKGLVLYGTVGNGKSDACKAIINRFASSKFVCKFMNLPEFLQALQDTIGNKEKTLEHELGLLITPHLLVLDDLGTEKESDWAAEKLFMTFEKRRRSGKHTFFTTNLNTKQIEAKYGARILDRMIESCSWVQFNGGSFRKRNFANEV